MLPVEDHSGADSYPPAREGAHTTASGYALKETVAHREPVLKQAFSRN